MAETLASALVGIVLGNLNSDVLQEIGLAWGLKNELSSLESVLSTIQLVVQDAEIKQRKSEVLQNWLRKLKYVAYDAENILDLITTEGLRRRANSERGMHHKLNAFLSLRNPLVFRFRIAHKVKNVRERLDAIAEERIKFHLREGVMDNRVDGIAQSRQTSSLVNESEIYGRSGEKEMIVEKVVDRSCVDDNLSVYAICGMGGLGKTTLAQLVYNDERVVGHFELRIWVCVSDDFSIQRLVRAIIESIDGGCNVSELDALQRFLQERLRGRRFLLVLDDVWSENPSLWDGLRGVLSCGSRGSAVIVTTRIEKVAIMMATLAVHKIGYLSEDDSWSLFRKRAFVTEEEQKDLAAIGKAIVKKCGGVPLAVKALGSLMGFKCHESEWIAIKESEIWHLSDDENGILPALRLSYDNLTPQMRQCFAYCCIFPKDYVMEKDQLIQLWLANGFLLPSEGQRDLQLAGHLIFKELVWRSFLQDVEKNTWGSRTCKMHDLMHDLAKSIMGPEIYIVEHDKVLKIPKTLRHLSFDRGASFTLTNDKGKLKMPNDKSLHSLVVHGGQVSAWKSGFSSFLSKQHYLRVLDANHYIIERLPKLVCKLEQLKYLSMPCYDLERLPESLTCLHNLQTLKLTESHKLLELPKGLKYMKNLWVLDIETFYSLQCTPPGLGDLTYLQRLSIFIVGEDPAHQIDQLKELDLGGKLSIQGLDNVRKFEDARSANLMKKKYLTSLSLSWTKGTKEESVEHFEEVLEGLRPHENLEKISVSSYQGSRFPNWISTPELKNLTEINLLYSQRCEHLPALGKLSCLKFLNLRAFHSINRLDAEWHGDGESSFPALEHLTISDMPNLEEWILPDSVSSFPRLRHLDLSSCPKLTGLPFLPALESLITSGNRMTFLKSIRALTSITSLCILNFSEAHVLPDDLLQNHKALEFLQIGSLPVKTLSNMLDNLPSLKTLILDYCFNLEFLPEGLDSLERLEIRHSTSLTSFSAMILDSFPSLRSLSIQNCKKLVNPLSGRLEKTRAPLQDLLINGCPELKILPGSIEQLSELTRLDIWHCEGLCSLPDWIGNLKGLSEMSIWNNTNLNSLPDTFQNLRSLRKLDIRGCPLLEKRCKKPKGEDWPKISHIPDIRINKMIIQSLDI